MLCPGHNINLRLCPGHNIKLMLCPGQKGLRTFCTFWLLSIKTLINLICDFTKKSQSQTLIFFFWAQSQNHDLTFRWLDFSMTWLEFFVFKSFKICLKFWKKSSHLTWPWDFPKTSPPFTGVCAYNQWHFYKYFFLRVKTY